MGCLARQQTRKANFWLNFPHDSLAVFGAKSINIYVSYYLRHVTFTRTYNFRLGCANPTEGIVQSTGKFLVPMQTQKVATPHFGMRWYATLSHM
jgi:hypothetical protein